MCTSVCNVLPGTYPVVVFLLILIYSILTPLTPPTHDMATAAPKKGVFKALKQEFQQAKQKYGKAIKVFFQTPGPPWPARITRAISRTDIAQAYDVDEIRVRLWFDSPKFETLPVRVEVDAHKTLPKRLALLIAAMVEEHWKNELATELSMPEHLRSGWLVDSIFDWCEEKYAKFLQLEPTMLEAYLGFDDHGMTSRRYTLIDPQEQAQNAHEEESSGEQKLATDVGLTEEEKAKEEERRRRKALERQRVEDRERELKRLGAERKKEEAVRLRELGVDVSGPKILSKKEKAEIEARKGKGHRTAKTGSRATKYAGPGSKLEKETGKKKKHAASK